MAERKPIFFSRLEDRSLQGFKDWIHSMYGAMMKAAGKEVEPETYTPEEEAELEADWKAYWKEVDNPSESAYEKRVAEIKAMPKGDWPEDLEKYTI